MLGKMTMASPFYMFTRTNLPAVAIKSPLCELPPLYYGHVIFKNHSETVPLSDTDNHSPIPTEHAPYPSAYLKHFRSTLPLHRLAITSSKYILPEIQCMRKNNSTKPPPKDNKESKLHPVVKSQNVSESAGGGYLMSRIYILIDWFRNFSKHPLKRKEESQKWMAQKKEVQAKQKKKAKTKKKAKAIKKAKPKKKAAKKKEKKLERKVFAGCDWDDDPCKKIPCIKKKRRTCIPYCKPRKAKKKGSKEKPKEK